MIKKKIIILGGGLAGLSAAWHLQKKGNGCQLFEKESEIGGLCRSKYIQGFTFDYDGHLLHFKHKHAFNFIKSLIGSNLKKHERNSRIYTHSRYVPYPFQANLHGLPSAIVKECLFDFIKTRKNNGRKNKDILNFSSWINETFGKGIARHFMIPYNRKFWTVQPQELTCEWLDGFIPVPSLGRVIEGAVAESKRQLGYNAQFWYPKKGGIQVLAEAISSEIKGLNTLHEAINIDLNNKEVLFSNGVRQGYDKLIFSLPLPEILHLIKELPAQILSSLRSLRYTSVFNLNLGIEREHISDKHWIYFPEKKFSFFRVGFPANFSPGSVPRKTSSLYAEVSYSKAKPINKKTIVDDIMRDLVLAGLLRRTDRILVKDTNDIKYGYILYDPARTKSLEGIKNFLEENDIFSLGRYGSWRYMSMEGVLLDGKRVAEIF